MNENEFIDKEVAASKQAKSNTKNRVKNVKGNALSQILNGDFLNKEFVVNNLGFIFFIIFLLLLIVAKGYYGKQLLQNINQTQTSLDEMTADYVEVKARLEEETRRFKLVEKLGPRGLSETQNKTKVIRIKSKND